jgi:hypothetical protein
MIFPEIFECAATATILPMLLRNIHLSQSDLEGGGKYTRKR